MSKFKKLAVCGLAGVMALGVGASMTACKTTSEGNANELKVSTQFGIGDEHNAAYAKLLTQWKTDGGMEIKDYSKNPSGSSWEMDLNRDIEVALEDDNWKRVPDVVFFFSGNKTDRIKDALIPVSELVKKDADYAKNSIADDNIYSNGPVAGGIALFHNTDDLAANKIDTWAKLEGLGMNAANRPSEPNYIMSYILCDEIGLDVFKMINKETQWVDAAQENLAQNKISKTRFATAYAATCNRMFKIMNPNRADYNGADFKSGASKYFVGGHWSANAALNECKNSTNKTAAAVSWNGGATLLPAVKTSKDATTTKKIFIGGVSSGWMITKAAEKRGTMDQAIKFVKYMMKQESIDALFPSEWGRKQFDAATKTAEESVFWFDDRFDADKLKVLVGNYKDDTEGFPALFKAKTATGSVTVAEAETHLANFFAKAQ